MGRRERDGLTSRSDGGAARCKAAVLLWAGDGGRERRWGSDLRKGERRTRVRGREKMNRG
jgi:hypothetical protein